MTSKEKYYTPTIEEFHVGFEFGGKSYVSGEWIKHTLQETDHLDIDKIYKTSRVKHLDREDIESFNFIHTGRTIDDWYELKITRPGVMTAHTNRRFLLMHDFRTNQGVVIKTYDYETSDEGENTVYRGSCRNKSELKRILNQIGI
jgi:hypothetical protein